MFKIIAIILISCLVLNAGLSSAEDADLLEKFISDLCAALEGDRFQEFAKLIKQGARLDGQPIDGAAQEKIFAELKEAHNAYDYRKIYKEGLKGQKRFIAKGTFYLGGHKFSHLTLKLERGRDGWLIAAVDHCR